MRSHRGSNLIVTLSFVAVVFAAACGGNDADNHNSAATVAAATADSSSARVDSAGGEVSTDSSSAPVVGRWLTDANALALFTAMNSAQMAAANVELQGWRSDSVRAFAAAVVRNHAALQHSADSLAGRIALVPIAPALSAEVTATMQAQTDSMRAFHGGELDRAFLAQQVNGQGLMADYAGQLAGVAQRPELQAFLSSAAASVGSEVARAQALQRGVALSDSLVAAASADSAAKRVARRKH